MTYYYKILKAYKVINESCFGLHPKSQNLVYLQLQDENDLALVFKHIMQSDDIGMLDLLQDAHFPLNVLFGHPTPTRFASALLDELRGILVSGALLAAFPHHRKLTTVRRTADFWSSRYLRNSRFNALVKKKKSRHNG